jgi:hypothetical protein
MQGSLSLYFREAKTGRSFSTGSESGFLSSILYELIKTWVFGNRHGRTVITTIARLHFFGCIY